MCGFTGLLHFGKVPHAPSLVRKMADTIIHRGPDDDGYFHDDDIALGFRRLSIVDLEHGHQPMSNHDKSVWVTFNGEIYNHRELRADLIRRGYQFQTDHSDTEVLVHGWMEWGERLPEKLNGMFAFCIWDLHSRSAFFARDRYGIKPLYFSGGQGEKPLIFGSEVRAIHASGFTPVEGEAERVVEYFSTMNNWHGRTPFKDVWQLEPGHWMKVSQSGRTVHQYWDFTFPRQRTQPMNVAAEEFKEVLRDSLRRQVAADVPVMTYLSGGIDSTAVSYAAYEIDPNMRAYSCIFDLENVGVDAFVDEREFSRSAAQFLGIDRVELELPQDTAVHTLDKTVAALEYPRMGMAYVNYSIANRVSQDAKVVLSGLGGDEVTGGYVARYGLAPNANRQPDGTFIENAGFKRMYGASELDDPLAYFRRMLNVTIAKDELVNAFTPEFLAAAGGFDPYQMLLDEIEKTPSETTWDAVQYVDAKNYMHGLLTLEDKLSMVHSLETRVPLLDNELVDYLLETPWSLLCDGEVGKMLFREAVKDMVPESIYTKPKMGFGPPDASWYRGTLKSWVQDRLAYDKIKRRGVLQPQWVQDRLNEHFDESQNWVALIWTLLSFESWCDQSGVFGGNLTAHY